MNYKINKGNRWSKGLAWELLILSGILAVGFLLRAFYLGEILDNPGFSNPIMDASYHHYWAKGLATGEWLVPESYNDPMIRSIPYQKFPGYSYFLAFIYYIFGPNFLAARIVQMGLGLWNCTLAFVFGRKWFGSAVGFIFSAFMSSYWIFIYFEGELYSPVLLVSGALSLLYILSLWTEKANFLFGTLGGLVLGLFALIRANILLFVPVAIMWLAWVLHRRKNLPDFSLAVLGFVLGIILAVCPATIRNYVVANELVLISSNGGLNFFIGHNELSDGMTPTIPNLKELAGFDSWTLFDYPVIIRGLERKLGRSMTHSEASAYWRDEAIHYIKTHLWESLIRTLRKVVLFWGPKEIANPTEIHYDHMNSRILRKIPGNFSSILSLFIAGTILFFHNFKKRNRDNAIDGSGENVLKFQETQYEVIVLILLFIFTYFASFLPFFVSARFRVPIIPFLLLLGAYGLQQIGKFAANRDFLRVVSWLGVVVFLYAMLKTNIIDYKPDLAQWHFYRGSSFLQNGQTNMAIKEYLKSLRIKPDFPQAYNHIGAALQNQGKHENAIAYYLKALLIKPDFADALNNLGAALVSQGKYDEAIVVFNRALGGRPNYAQAYYNLGMAFAFQGKMEQAITHYTRALLINPDYAEAHYELGVIFDGQGQSSGTAIEHYFKALLIRKDYAEAHNNLGVILAEQGKLLEAITHFSRALQIKPDYSDARINLETAKGMDK